MCHYTICNMICLRFLTQFSILRAQKSQHFINESIYFHSFSLTCFAHHLINIHYLISTTIQHIKTYFIFPLFRFCLLRVFFFFFQLSFCVWQFQLKNNQQINQTEKSIEKKAVLNYKFKKRKKKHLLKDDF